MNQSGYDRTMTVDRAPAGFIWAMFCGRDFISQGACENLIELRGIELRAGIVLLTLSPNCQDVATKAAALRYGWALAQPVRQIASAA